MQESAELLNCRREESHQQTSLAFAFLHPFSYPYLPRALHDPCHSLPAAFIQSNRSLR